MQEEKNETKMEIEDSGLQQDPPVKPEEKSEKKEENKIIEEKPKKKIIKRAPMEKTVDDTIKEFDKLIEAQVSLLLY